MGSNAQLAFEEIFRERGYFLTRTRKMFRKNVRENFLETVFGFPCRVGNNYNNSLHVKPMLLPISNDIRTARFREDLITNENYVCRLFARSDQYSLDIFST